MRINYLKFSQFNPLGAAQGKGDTFLISEKEMLNTVKNAKNQRNYPFIISYSLMKERSAPSIVLKADGNIYMGWARTTPICSMENFNARLFEKKYSREIEEIINYNQLAFCNREIIT